MDTKEKQRNIKDARTYFNYNLTSSAQNDNMFYMGVRWFEKSRPLTMAPKQLADNEFFVIGYNDAKKRMLKKIFNEGYEHFCNGGSLNNIPDQYVNNRAFIKGFEKAQMDSLKNERTKNSSRR